ncbi:hypothetical protein B0H15DRAFT_832283 [Mycena belliarum]|uniref:F-box domain-containing protein n=1 Tax=Mycena belliarum TaxID=1033014 RepID=A0AAD6U8X4_9AGAR|nr:hypothetical protein B0H15DRAFT_832283 [Mycena belliae]
MAAPLQLLDLPPELILACLVDLPYTDLSSCLKTRNRLLYNIIANSVLIRYRLVQDKACVAENSPRMADSSILDRLAALRRHEADWLNFTPRSRHTLTIDFETSGVYDLTSDVYLVGNTPDPITSLCTGIKYIHTSPDADAPRWQLVEAGKPIIDFGTALEEHDLIAMVTYNVLDGEPNMRSIEVVLLEFSTGHTHPLAAHSTLHIHDVEAEMERPGISIEIVGENLVLSLVYWGDGRRDMDTLHIYNWMTGIPKMAPLDVSNTGIVFLAMDTILIPNAEDRSLDIYRIPPSSEVGALPRLLHSFNLPELAPPHMLLSFQCRGEPNPRAGYTRPSRAAFLPRADSALLLVSFEVQLATPHGTSEHVLVIARALLLTALAACDPDIVDISWPAWGPWCTRFFDMNELSTHYITTTCGTRMVAIAPDARIRPAPVRIFDFNEPNGGIRQMLRGANPTPTNVRIVEADEEEGAVARAPFAEPVFSRLPYVETVSEELFTYAAVLINDANIIGVKFGEVMVDTLEVLHFG